MKEGGRKGRGWREVGREGRSIEERIGREGGWGGRLGGREGGREGGERGRGDCYTYRYSNIIQW